jgi:hypothetical protein
MSTSTPAINLVKPDPTENVDIAVLNANSDKVDAAFAGIVAAYRNVLRNGDMNVAQRGIGGFTAALSYTVDGWMKDHTGGTHTVTRTNPGIGSGLGINGALGQLDSVVAGQAAAGDYAQIKQRIESVRAFAGQQVTLSFLAVATAGTPKIGVEVVQSFGTGGAPSADVNTAISAITISTVGNRYSVSFIVPSITGKTIGTAGNDYLMLNLWVSAGSTFAARASNIGIQNSTITITDIQLEAGSVATAFERLPQQVQLAWCQRYFYQDTVPNFRTIAQGFAYGTTTALINVHIPVPMRAVPALSYSALASWVVYNTTATGIALTALSSDSNNTANSISQRLNATVAAGLVAGSATGLASAVAAWIAFSAEL